MRNKENIERTKQATLEETHIVTRALVDIVSANTLRFFEIPGLPRDYLFNIGPENWVHMRGETISNTMR